MKKRFRLLLLVVAVLTVAILADSVNGQQDVHASFAGKSGGKISKDEIAAATTLDFVGADSSWMITECKISVATKEWYKTFELGGNVLTETMKSTLMKAPAGSKIYFEYIRAGKGKELGTRQVPPLSFTVVE